MDIIKLNLIKVCNTYLISTTEKCNVSYLIYSIILNTIMKNLENLHWNTIDVII